MEYITLSQLQKRIKFALEDNIRECWVVAEISELKVNNSGHCYMMFVEKGGANQVPKAKISGVIWRSSFTLLNSYFKDATGSYLKAGLKVLMQVSINYHELYGLSLLVKNIDPTYTLGDMERQRQECIKKIKEDGIFDDNKEQELNTVVERIAIVSSDKAAGYQDFINELQNNEFGYRFATTLHVAFMQGGEAENSMINALTNIARNQDDYDAVVIIRGGGAQSDLACFDSYRLCSYIAQFPLPVITGIGHNKDISVADMVAFKSVKTPTAVARFLVDNMNMFEKNLDEKSSFISKWAVDVLQRSASYMENLSQELRNSTKEVVHAQNILLNNYQSKIKGDSKTILKIAMQKCNYLHQSIKEKSKSYLINQGNLLNTHNASIKSLSKNVSISQKSKLQLLESQIKSFDPERIVNMGYSLIMSEGKILHSVDSVEVGTTIDIKVADGVLKSKITEKIRKS